VKEAVNDNINLRSERYYGPPRNHVCVNDRYSTWLHN
jgi:hypothetical protein